MKALILPVGSDTGTGPLDRALVGRLTAIANQPLLRYTLRILRNAGITEIGVLAGPDIPAITDAFGAGDALGVSLHYLAQSRVADARPFLGTDDFVVCSGRSLIADGIVDLADQFRATRPSMQVVVHKVAEAARGEAVEVDAGGSVLRWGDPADPVAGTLAVAGVYFCTPAVHDVWAGIAADHSGDAELRSAIRRLLAHGGTVTAQRYYGYWKDIRTTHDALDANRWLLAGLRTEIAGEVDQQSELDGPVVVAAGAVVHRCRIVGPALIGPGAVVENSELGPNIAIGANCAVRASTLAESIVLSGTAIVGVNGLSDCVLGRPRRTPSSEHGGATRLRARESRTAPGLLGGSLAARRGVALEDADAVTDWLAARARAQQHHVERVRLSELDGWSTEPETGNLVHHSGKFFTVAGLDVSVSTSAPDAHRQWQQPILLQPEIGILGILAKEFDGVLHFLMQAKMEPGNVNLVQLSPTVQATRSNYTGVHNGSAVPYLQYLTQPGRGQVITDVLQSEHGAWFSGKVNRNMIVLVTEDIPVGEDFCWLTLGQLGDVLRRDNALAMDTRAVLACAPVVRPGVAALHSDTELLSWFTEERSRYEVRSRHIPLNTVSDWYRDDWSIRHDLGRYFQVVGVSVSAGSREVSHWTQPLLAPAQRGVCAFVLRRIDGVPHLLVHARTEGGFLDTVELGPTVQCTPKYYGKADQPPFLDLVLGAATDRIRYATVQSEEGGRLCRAENSYLIVEADESEAPTQPPPGYQWATVGQLNSLLRHSRYVNIQARTLLAAINTGAADLCG